MNIFLKLGPPALFIVLCGMFLRLALHVYFADSEIWLLTLSQHALAPGHLSSVYYKWSFHAATYLFSHFAPGELAVYEWARAGWWAVGVATIVATARLFTRIYKKPGLFWPLAIFLLTSSVYFNQAFRIRGDIFSYFLHVIYMLVFTAALGGEKQKRTFYLLLGINLLMAVSTPKFVLLIAAQFILGFFLVKSSAAGPGRKKDMLWLLVSSHSAMVIMVCAAVLLSPAIPGSYNLLLPVAGAVDFYLKSFDSSYGNPLYFTSEDFMHLGRFFKISWVHGLALAAWLGFSLLRWRKTVDPAFLGPQLYALLIFTGVIFYNQKFPFFLGPFLTPVLAQSFCFLFHAFKNRRSWLLTAVFVAAPAQGGVRYYENMKYNSNQYQKAAIARLEKFALENPRLKIYDVIGLLPRLNRVFAFVGPSEVARKANILQDLENTDPDVIIQTFKSHYLDPQFMPLVTSKWVPIEKNVWAKGFVWTRMEHPQHFKKVMRLNKQHYWILPWPGKKYFSDLTKTKPINSETYPLNAKFQVTTSDPIYLAVPKKYGAIVFSDTPPIGFAYSPYVLFRYDTSF